MRILHLITGLDIGGAEMMLFRLCKQQIIDGNETFVISIKSGGKLKTKLLAEKIPVYELGFPKGKFSISGYILLIKHIHKIKPDVIHCWMYHANFLGGLVSFFSKKIPIVWAIHNTTLSMQNSSKTTILLMRVLGLLSYLPEKIIYCSQLSKELHEKFHYSKKKGVFIPNGVDKTLFSPNLEAGKEFLLQMNIEKKSFVVGMIGRFDPQKDYPNFLAAASILQKSYNDIQFVLCGPGVDVDNNEIMQIINKFDHPSMFHLLGSQFETQKVHNSFDTFILSSVSEAFPIVLAEAMACGVPCVSTDVGDAAYIIADTGYVVPVKDPQAIADAVNSILSLPEVEREQLKASARARIVENFSLEKIAQLYKETYEEVISTK